MNIMMKTPVREIKIEPFRSNCVKCLSAHRPRVLLKIGPHTFRWEDYLAWECVECHAQWFTETADHKPLAPQYVSGEK